MKLTNGPMAFCEAVVTRREQALADGIAAAQEQRLPQRRCRAIANDAMRMAIDIQRDCRLWHQYAMYHAMANLAGGIRLWQVRFDDDGERQERVLCANTLAWSEWQTATVTPSPDPDQCVE